MCDAPSLYATRAATLLPISLSLLRHTQAWWYNSQIDYRGTNSQTGVFRQSKTA